ncbi:MAG: hypothetical protein V1709_10735 [Planctomycetota bacterium]
MRKTLIVLTITTIFLLVVFSITIIAGNSSQDLKTGVKQKDNQAIKKAVEELVQQNDEKAFSSLTESLGLLETPPDIEAYWEILRGIGRLTNKDVISKTAIFILNNQNKDLGNDLLAAMKSNPSETVVPLLGIILEKGTNVMQLECIRQLGSIYVKESLVVLINYLNKLNPDKPDNTGTISALKDITGADHGIYPRAWIKWWEENKNKNASELIHPKLISDTLTSVISYRPNTGVQTLEKEKVIVIRNDKCDKNPRFDGNYDKIQDILERLGIPHAVVGKSELDKESYSLDDKWALVFNCNFFYDHCCDPEHAKLKPSTQPGETIRTSPCPGQPPHQMHNTKLSDKTIKKIKQFVETGGYLFTEDLNIEEIIERAFKGVIVHTKYIGKKEVKILPAPGALLHPYLKYVFETPPLVSSQTPSGEKPGETKSVKAGSFYVDGTWNIHNQSPDIKIQKKDTAIVVTVLIMSPELTKADKVEGAVAVTWAVSDKTNVVTDDKTLSYKPGGRVLHIMSHFGEQRSQTDEFTLQNLILNFFMELNEHHPRKK